MGFSSSPDSPWLARPYTNARMLWALLAGWDFISLYALPFKCRQLCSACTALPREQIILAALCYPVSSVPAYRQLLNRSLGMFRENTVNTRDSCICSVMTDIIKQFSLCRNWFNIGGMSLLAAHMAAYFLQTRLHPPSSTASSADSLPPHVSPRQINRLEITSFHRARAWLQLVIRRKNVLTCFVCFMPNVVRFQQTICGWISR